MRKIDGPKFYLYPDRNSFRVVGVDGAGRVSQSFASREAALAFIADKRAKTETRTVSEAIDAYRTALAAKGQRGTTLDTVVHRLNGLLRVRDRDLPLRSITAATARTLWSIRCREVGGDTQRGELATARAFFAWCGKQGWCGADPFAACEPTLPRSAGKPQLRIDEARKLYAVALAEYDAKAATRLDRRGRPIAPLAYTSGLATAMLLTMGMRVDGLAGRVVRDVDDGGRVLWIDRSKTTSGEGAYAVPEDLVERLAAFVEGRAADDALFPKDRHWLAYHVRRLCGAAGVPVVSPHGLRGTFTSLSGERRGIDEVARALGHADAGVTRKHYLAPGVERAAKQKTALRVLQGGQK